MPILMQCFRVLANTASDVSGLIFAFRILFHKTVPLQLNLHFPRLGFAIGMCRWPLCLASYSGTLGTVWKILWNRQGICLVYQRYINLPNTYLLISEISSSPSSRNNGSVWSLYPVKVMIRTLLFCNSNKGLRLVAYALPHTWLQ